VSYSFVSVSKQMIDQFFTAVEEIEYDWQLPYQNVIFEEDDDRLEQIVEK
jgi:hypothetical protein